MSNRLQLDVLIAKNSKYALPYFYSSYFKSFIFDNNNVYLVSFRYKTVKSKFLAICHVFTLIYINTGFFKLPYTTTQLCVRVSYAKLQWFPREENINTTKCRIFIKEFVRLL